MRLSPTRREFLRLAATGVAAGLAAACSAGDGDAGELDPSIDGDGDGKDDDASAPPPATRNLDGIPASAAFALGVMAGDALVDRAILWTRYTGENALALYVEQEDGPALLEVGAVPDEAGFVHVDAGGLQAGKWHRYAFLELGPDGEVFGRSALGHVRAALPPDALEPVTFAGVSCTSQFREVTNANLGRLARRTDLSFVVHAGDQLYADFPEGEPAMDLADYRAKYAYAWTRPGLSALHAAVGMYNTWADHEVYNNWQGTRDTARIEAGVQTFFEHQPIRRAPGAPRRLWRSFRWGKTLELFVLDGRAERDATAGRYLSEEQLAWVAEGLRGSDAVFKLVLSSCPIGRFPSDTIDQWRSPTDRWANPAYAAQRTRILDVAQEIGGVWWLSGDFHFGTVGRVEYPDVERYTRVREVLMGAGGSGLGTSDAIPAATRVTQVRSLDDNRNWTFATPENNYVVIRANPLPDETHPTPWLGIAFYDATTQLYSGEYRLL